MIVGSIPVFQNKILLAKRGIEPRKGYWNLPCGFLELNESIETGALRELKEETGAEMNIDYLHTIYSVLPSGQVYLIFKGSLVSDRVVLTTESTEIEFFEIDKIPWKDIAFSSNEFALKKYIEDLDSSFKNVHFGTFKGKFT